MVSADEGGSNGSRVRLFKVELQMLADETGLTLQVCHDPKWRPRYQAERFPSGIKCVPANHWFGIKRAWLDSMQSVLFLTLS